MQTFLYPLLIGAAVITAVCVRYHSNIRSWWINCCDEAECSSTAATLYQALEPYEHKLLLEHAHADTIRNLEQHDSPTLAALARDLEDYVNPPARLFAIQRALERQQCRRGQSQGTLAH